MKFIFLGCGILLAGGIFWFTYAHSIWISPPAPGTLKAVYLVRGKGELPMDKLKAHPEIAITGSFLQLKQYAKEDVALWIDKNAVELLDKQWLDEEPQSYFPIVLVGYNNPLYCFRDVLRLEGFLGPPIDWPSKKLTPGFCIIQGEKTERSLTPFTMVKIFKGYDYKPRVQDILDITNNLLEDNQQSPKISPSSQAPTPTPIFQK